MRSFFIRTLTSLQQLLPSCCALCQLPTIDTSEVCTHCEKLLSKSGEHYCHRCAIPISSPHTNLCTDCRCTPPWYDASLCAFLYEGITVNLLNRMKSKADLNVCNYLSDKLSQCIVEQYASCNLPDIIVPAPMLKRKYLNRLCNPAQLVAESVANRLQINLNSEALTYKRAPKHQKSLSKQARRLNIKGVFECNHDMSGMHVAVIDDIVTTSETVNELARMLKQKGAMQVDVWAIARTPTQSPSSP